MKKSIVILIKKVCSYYLLVNNLKMKKIHNVTNVCVFQIMVASKENENNTPISLRRRKGDKEKILFPHGSLTLVIR